MIKKVAELMVQYLQYLKGVARAQEFSLECLYDVSIKKIQYQNACHLQNMMFNQVNLIAVACTVYYITFQIKLQNFRTTSMEQFIGQEEQNIQGIQRPQSPTFRLKQFFQQSKYKIAFVNPLKNLFQNFSKLKLDSSLSLNQLKNNNSHTKSIDNSKESEKKSINLDLNSKKIIGKNAHKVLSLDSQIIDTSQNINKQTSSQMLQQSKISGENEQSDRQDIQVPDQENQDLNQNSISKIQKSESMNQHQLSSSKQKDEIFSQQKNQSHHSFEQQKLLHEIQNSHLKQNAFKSRQSTQKLQKVRQNNQMDKHSSTAFSKLSQFFVQKSPQKCKQKQSEVNKELMQNLQNLNISENSNLTINNSRQLAQSNQNIFTDSKQSQNKQKNSKKGQNNSSNITILQQKNVDSRQINDSHILSKNQKKTSTKQEASGVQQNIIKQNQESNHAKKSNISSNSLKQSAILQKSKYEIPMTYELENNQFSNIQFKKGEKISQRSYRQEDKRKQSENQQIVQDMPQDKLEQQNYQQQYRRIVQSANIQDIQFNQRSSKYQNNIKKRVGTQMNSYDKKAKQIKSKQIISNKFSKINKNHFQAQQGIFNTQVNTNFNSSKVTKIIQAKQYKKKILEEELAKVSSQIENLQKKQISIRQSHSPNQFIDRVKINNDPLARKKAISLVKNLRTEKIQRVKAKISQFEHVDKKINDYMDQLTKIRQENQIRTKQKKQLEIIERMKKKEMQKMKEQKKLNANVQFVHQFRQQKAETKVETMNLKPNSPSVKSPQSKQRRRSEWSQADQDGATPQLANKKAYLNKIRNLSNKKSSRLDMYQNRLN